MQGDVELLDFVDKTFDVAVMWDVIEHLIRPVVALKELRRVLKPGGYLFVSTDDANHWLPRLLGRHWWGPRRRRCTCVTFPGMGCGPPVLSRAWSRRPSSVTRAIIPFRRSSRISASPTATATLKALGARLDRTPLGVMAIRV